MRGVEIRVEGLETLQKRLKGKANLNDVKRVVKANGTRLTREMKAQTKQAYVKGYSTGDTAGSINLEITDAGMTAKVGPTMSYDPYVEYGTRYMKAEPIVQPSLQKIGPQFIKDLSRIMED